MKQNFAYRLASAIVALIILFVAIFYGRETGIFILSIFVVFRGSFEAARLFFQGQYPDFAKPFIVGLSLSVYSIITFENFHVLSEVMIVFAFMIVAVVGILFHRSFKNIEDILTFSTKCIMTIVYTCYLPATIVWISRTNQGIEWFLCLLAVVFAGDIGAYVFGSLFGKTKIAPLLSPKKSLQGGLGGLAFSIGAALAFSVALPNTPILVLFVCGLVGGFLGQIGDFFESLIKRVAGVKDSGSIMPGHGGILDRLDGVLLAAPLFYIVSQHYSL